jgi:phenylalanyl-tRNA synthetase alpha chain
MPELEKKIQEVSNQFAEELKNSKNKKDIQNTKIKFLGKKGVITLLFTNLKEISAEEKRICGPLLNQLKNKIDLQLKEKENIIRENEIKSANQKKQNFDVSSYKTDFKQGHLHVYSQICKEIEDIFTSMGYEILDGPELESVENNFNALNIPEDHPARDMHDTFWVNVPEMLMRTQTSPVQIRSMKSKELPIAAVAPGRCYRQEATDASHDFMFMQCEGFLIDKTVTLPHLFATAQNLLQAILNKKNLDIRIRPGFFPFVEPGVEIDIRCPFCKNGCSVCKQSTWIEVFPCGLIHPNVLKSSGIDPEKHSGYAFGFGLTRLAMIKYNINDIRLFHSGKIRFLEQF